MIKINKLLNCSERSYNEYLAKKILKDINNWKEINLIKISYLNKLDLIDFPNILCCFNTFINKNLQESLVKFILLSRSSKEIDLACSNAATILAKSDFIFKDINFSRIRIPKADLSQHLFVDVNFEGSCLKEVNFVQSQFYNVNFKNCDLSSSNFGYFKIFSLTKGKMLSFSHDDKSFWYKNDDNIIEIDLESKRIRNKYNFIDFISTNVYRICYRLMNKSYSTRVQGQYIRLWDNYENNLVYDINIHRLTISPNLKLVAALNGKSAVVSWDFDQKIQFLGTSKKFSYRGGKLLFSPSNRCLAIIRTKSISLIETKTWTLYRKIWGNFPVKNIFTISYCSQKIAFVYYNNIFLLDTITSAKTKIFTISKILCLSFSPCSKFLAVGIEENYGFIIDIKSHQILQAFTGFESHPISVIFSISGKYISWSDLKGNVRTYEFSQKVCYNDSERHLKINWAKLSPKGTYLITSSSENSILWNMNNFNPKQIKKFLDYSPKDGFVFSPHESYLVRALWSEIQFYNTKNFDFLIKVSLKRLYFNFSYSFSYCENYLICLEGSVYEYYSVPSFLVIRKIDIRHLRWTHIGFSECGNYDFFHNYQNIIYIWDLVKGDCIKKLPFWGSHDIRAATFHLSKIAYLVTRKEQTYIDVIDIETGEVINIQTPEGYFSSLQFADSEGTELIEISPKGFCEFWDLKKKSIKKKLCSSFLKNIGTIEIINNSIIIRNLRLGLIISFHQSYHFHQTHTFNPFGFMNIARK